MRPSSASAVPFVFAGLLLGCQPTLVDIQYDKEAPLYGGDDDPGGSTGAGDDGGGGTVDPGEPISGDFRMAYESDGGFLGAMSCEAWWTVAGEPASTECPDCGFTLDWAYDVAYTLDADAVSLPSGCEFTTPGFLATSGSYGDQVLQQYMGTWAFSADYGGGGQFLLGYAYYGEPYWRPLAGTEVSVGEDSLEWRYVNAFEYGDYGYYDAYSVTETWAGYVSGE